MMRTNKVLATVALVALLVAAMATTGCITRTEIAPQSPLSAEDTRIEVTGDALKATIEMGAGVLKLDSRDSDPAAIETEFSYRPQELQPTVEHSVDGSLTVVSVTQPEFAELALLDAQVDSRWKASLPTSIPTDLVVRLGAGEGDLDLRGMALRFFALEQGAGDVSIDLSEQDRDLMAQATLGAGEVTIKVPADVRVRVTGYADGLGDWSAPGFTKVDGALVNAAYADESLPLIEFDVQRGVGQINVVEAR